MRSLMQVWLMRVCVCACACGAVVVKEGSNIGKLFVDVVECKDLKSRDIISGSADPYAVVQG